MVGPVHNFDPKIVPEGSAKLKRNLLSFVRNPHRIRNQCFISGSKPAQVLDPTAPGLK
jgi:hypothetical protein